MPIVRALLSSEISKKFYTSGIIRLIERGYILVEIFLLKKHAKSGTLCLNIVINHYLLLATDGFIDSNNDIILSNIHFTERQAQCLKKQRNK